MMTNEGGSQQKPSVTLDDHERDYGVCVLLACLMHSSMNEGLRRVYRIHVTPLTTEVNVQTDRTLQVRTSMGRSAWLSLKED